MNDPVLQGWLEAAANEWKEINLATDRLRIEPTSHYETPPRVYPGLVHALPHFERAPDGTAREVIAPIFFSLRIPDDYLRSSDSSLQFRVATVEPRVLHPNCKGGAVCLGPTFTSGTSFRALVEQVYDILSSRILALDHAFDAEGRHVYLANLDRVKALRAAAPPLWRRPLAARVRVEDLRGGAEPEEGAR